MKIAAVDIGGTAVKSCLWDGGRPFRPEEVRETPARAAEGGEAVLRQVEQILSSMPEAEAVAVSTAGQVDPVRGSIIFATDNIPGYTGMPVKKILEESLHRPVLVENDVNAAAVGEAEFGAGRDFRDFLCLTFGTGIGGAIVMDHRLYRGASCSAAEMGHILTHAGGRRCTCGNRGCYEAYASTSALSRLVLERSGLHLNGRQIFAAARENGNVRTALEEWMHEVIWGLVSLIHVFNPPCVILGGGIMKEVSVVRYIRGHLPDFLMESFRGVRICRAELGNSAGLLGAARLAENLFQNQK